LDSGPKIFNPRKWATKYPTLSTSTEGKSQKIPLLGMAPRASSGTVSWSYDFEIHEPQNTQYPTLVPSIYI